jgi:hypothetical protein
MGTASSPGSAPAVPMPFPSPSAAAHTACSLSHVRTCSLRSAVVLFGGLMGRCTVELGVAGYRTYDSPLNSAVSRQNATTHLMTVSLLVEIT